MPPGTQADLLGGGPSPVGVQRLFFALVPAPALRQRIAASAGRRSRRT